MTEKNSTIDQFIGNFRGDTEFFTHLKREKYKRYQNIWSYLVNDTLKHHFTLEFKKKFNFENFIKEFYTDNYPFSEEHALQLLSSCGWRKNPYDRQHWGVWLHSLSPYQGRITPSFAHWLIKIFSDQGDTVFDPFCGVGTVPLEAVLLERKAIGNDLSPYAYLIAKGKFSIGKLEENLDYLRELSYIKTDNISLDNIPAWIKAYFEERTIKEIIYLVNKFKQDEKYFLLSCLMGILHGNRPGYLSVYTGCIIPMKPRSREHPKFRPDKDAPEYRAVLPRLAAKIMRMYETPVPENFTGKILNEDTRKLSLEKNSVDVIISSPPYYDTLDYVGVNKVRLFFLDYDSNKQEELKKNLIQDKTTYIEEMIKCGQELKRVLKPDKNLVFILGDVHYQSHSINTAYEVSQVYQQELGFEYLTIVNDEIPLNKTASRTKRTKFDRVLVMKNKK